MRVRRTDGKRRIERVRGVGNCKPQRRKTDCDADKLWDHGASVKRVTWTMTAPERSR